LLFFFITGMREAFGKRVRYVLFRITRVKGIILINLPRGNMIPVSASIAEPVGADPTSGCNGLLNML
jgi:hypothetical protein